MSLLKSVIIGAAVALIAGTAAAQTAYPMRPIKLVVPYAAGGGTDAIARLVAQGVGERLGQTMVVENNGAAGGNIATQQAAGAAPDGYTVLMANQGPMVVNPHMFKSVKIDPLAAFDPVTMIASAPLVLVVPKASPLASFEDFVTFAKKNPGKLSYGSAGNGSASHLAALLLGQVARLDMVHVPYRGAGPALNDLVGGQTNFMITTLPSVAGLVEGGQLRALAVTGKSRVASLPAIPAVAEKGYPDYEASAWYGFAVPKGTPKDIVKALREATIAAITGSVLKERLASEGAVPVGNSAEAFGDMMRQESTRWASVIKESGFKLD
ncbi:tripartite tricarboxylate transporter substrate binding protein [uncultured Alsobacter sp.]|uniref:Bug family tripartite tricarboxylate transporter substrate binding protein n=1 Tax=uncultured Alsobacter sp. TaxID=1748258 RepID=UPI0025FA5A96|nr:tripartite tricarboxylate transporter substrate binding protein [uncultured Alsobacter sp.]